MYQVQNSTENKKIKNIISETLQSQNAYKKKSSLEAKRIELKNTHQQDLDNLAEQYEQRQTSLIRLFSSVFCLPTENTNSYTEYANEYNRINEKFAVDNQLIDEEINQLFDKSKEDIIPEIDMHSPLSGM